MTPMQKIIMSIQDFDQNPALSITDIFTQQKHLFDEIHASTAFGELRLDDGQILKNMLDGIVKNKLSAFETALSKKTSHSEDISIQEMFVQKVSKTCENHIVKGDEPPIYNMGVKGEYTESEKMAFPRHLDNYKLISTPEGVVPVLRCISTDGIAGHDWVTFSFCQSTLDPKYAFLDPSHCEDALTDGIETWLDQILFEIFGFGLARKREKGMHWYSYSYELQDNLGMVLYGHKSKRIAIQINGSGCALARSGWNERLYDFLKKDCVTPKLNRVDLAFDDFDGEFITCDIADQWDDQDLFLCGGRSPDINKFGNWKRINGKGRTLTVGDRTSYKYARIYERGKKEGDNMSPWVRAEIEFKSTAAHIPLEILLYPSDYFVGAYPAFEQLAKKLGQFTAPTKCEIVKKQSKINELKAIDLMKHQFGKYIRFFAKYIEPSELVRLLSSNKDEVPKRLTFSMAAVSQALRINQPIASESDELPLFVGADYLLDKPRYEGLIHAI